MDRVDGSTREEMPCGLTIIAPQGRAVRQFAEKPWFCLLSLYRNAERADGEAFAVDVLCAFWWRWLDAKNYFTVWLNGIP